MSVSIECRDYDSLSDSECDLWRMLADTPLQTPEWLLSWCAAFDSRNVKQCLLTAIQAGHMIGFAPLISRRCWSFGRVLKFAGSGSACTDFQTLLASPQHAHAVADAVAEWLMTGAGRGTWDVLELEGLGKDSASIGRLLSRLAEHRTIQQTTHLENTWRLDLREGWTGFLQNLSKSQRAQTRNLVNRFEKDASLQFRVIGQDGEALCEAIGMCAELHQKRWNAINKSGCFADRRFMRFVSCGTTALASLGRAEVAVLEQHGQAIATQLILKDDKRNQFVYQSGRDPQFDSQRIGQILTLLAIRHACDSGAQFVDYLRGNELYKSRLRAVPSECRRIRVFAPGLLPKLRYGAWQLNRQLIPRPAIQNPIPAH